MKKEFPTFKKFLLENDSSNVILMGGLDYRNGDMNISQQADLLRVGDFNVTGFRYNDLVNVKKSLSRNPDAIVVLFSAGCSYASQIAQSMNDKSKLFIVEPYAASVNTVNSVRTAVSMGVPNTNIIAGPTKGRGLGIVSGATKTPEGINHWGALKFAGSKLKTTSNTIQKE